MPPPLPHALALDIGGTKLTTGVVSAAGVLSGVLIEPTDKARGASAVLDHLFAMGRRSAQEANVRVSDLLGVGISCGGPLDPTTGVLHEPLHLPGWIDVPIVDRASSEYGIPSLLVNDASAGAWGEFCFGVGRGSSSLVYLTVSTGMGGGAVLAGNLHAGASGNGGEFGHIMVHADGRQCTCGRRGCVEAYACGTSIAARAAEAVAAGEASVLASLPAITAADVAAHVPRDPLASRIWQEAMQALSTAATDLVNVFEPEVLVLGGGVTRSGDLLLDPVREAVLSEAMPPAAAAVRVELAGLGGLACLAGAGALAINEFTPGTTREEGNRSG